MSDTPTDPTRRDDSWRDDSWTDPTRRDDSWRDEQPGEEQPWQGHADEAPAEEAVLDPDEAEGRPPWVTPTIVGVAALLVGLLAGWLTWSGGDDDSGELESLQSQLSDLTAEKSDLQEQYDELSAEVDALGEAGGEKASTLEELTAQNADLTEQVETLTGDLDTVTGEKDALAEEVAGLERENADLREQIEGILDDIDASVVAAPDLTGGTAAAAVARAEENDWVVIQIPTATTEVAPGTVLSQTPVAGTPMLAGSALAISVATAPEPPPSADAETIFEQAGNGPATTAAVNLEPGVRHFLTFTFEGDGRHGVSVVDADGDEVAQLVDLNGPTEAGTALSLVGSYRFSVETDGAWTLKVVTLP